MINKAILVGNLGKDPEVRKVNDTSVAQFSLATTKNWKDKDGTKQSSTEWHNIKCWRGLAEVVEKYCKKGDKVYIEGEINYREYEKDGVKKYITEITATELKMLGSPSGGTKPAASGSGETLTTPPSEENDLPF